MIKLHKLSYHYPQMPLLLGNISFELKPSEITAVLGPNGIGKTTLLGLMCRILLPSKGSLFLDGVDFKKLSLKEIAKNIAYVPQSVFPTFSLSVFDYVLLGRAPHLKGLSFENKQDIDIAMTCLKETNTLKFKDRSLQTLSHGEKQRVVLAKALCQQPKVLLLDEPTAHLDLKSQIELLQYVKELQKNKNLTVCMVLHDIELASEFSDQIIFLKDQTIFSKGPTQKLLNEQNLKAVFDVNMSVDKNPFTHNSRITYKDLHA